MDLSYVLLMYLLAFVAIVFMMVKMGRSVVSSILIAMVVDIVLLLLIYPPCKIEDDRCNPIVSFLYGMIVILTVAASLIYVFINETKLGLGRSPDTSYDIQCIAQL